MTRQLLVAAIVLGASATSSLGSFEPPSPILSSPPGAWVMYGHDPGRSAYADASALPASPEAFELAWNAHGGAGGLVAYARASVGELIQERPGKEMVVTAANMFGGGGGVSTHGADGTLLWGVTFLEGAVGPPLIGDFNGDGWTEVFVSHGQYHDMLMSGGHRLWRAGPSQRTGETVSVPLAIDVTGDGVLDVIQVGIIAPDPPAIPLQANETPLVFAFDGPTGQIVFEHALPCGRHGTHPLATEDDGQLLVIVGCTYIRPTITGVPGSTVQALRFEAAQKGLLDPVLEALGLRSPVDVHVQWSHPIRRNAASIWNIWLADVHEQPGAEVVVMWTQDQVLGITVLSLDGNRIAENALPEENVGTISLAAGDLTGDGLDDLVFWRRDRISAYAFADGVPTFLWSVPGQEEVHAGFALRPAGVALADLEGDGEPEVITGWSVGITPAEIRIYSAQGQLRWTSGPLPIDPLADPIRNAVMADFDEDGRLDLVYPADEQLLAYRVRP